MHEEKLSQSQAAWNGFAERLKQIGEKITGPTGARDGRERAEGYRYLLRLISAGQELELEADRRHPVLVRMMTPTRQFKGGGTDTLYHEAKVDEQLTYKLSLRRGDDIFFSSTVYAYDENDAYYIVDHLIDHEIVFDNVFGAEIADIYLSAERPEGVKNWLQLKGRDPILFARQYFPEFVTNADTGKYRGAIMNVECLSDVAIPDAFTEDDLEAGLQKVVDFIEDATDVCIGLSIFAGLNLIEFNEEGKTRNVTHIADGNLILDEERSDDFTPAELAQMIDPKLVANNLPGPGIQYLGAWYKLEDDEAILIEGMDVPCRYWSCQILTRYLESGDFRYHRVGINNREIVVSEDGSFQIYACAKNPGVENWLSTQGYTSAHILIRTLMADPQMEATFKVVKIADIPT